LLRESTTSRVDDDEEFGHDDNGATATCGSRHWHNASWRTLRQRWPCGPGTVTRVTTTTGHRPTRGCQQRPSVPLP